MLSIVGLKAGHREIVHPVRWRVTHAKRERDQRLLVLLVRTDIETITPASCIH